MPKKQVVETLSEESLKALYKFRLRYFLLLIGFTIIGTLVLQLALGALQSFWFGYMAKDYAFVFPLKNFALWYPSLLLAFLISSLVAFRLNRTLQKDGLSFFLEELQEEAQGYRSFGPKRWIQYGLGVVLFVLLLLPQFRASVRAADQSIEHYSGWSELEQFTLDSFNHLAEEQGHPVLYFEDSLKIDLDDYNYSKVDLMKFLDQ